MLVEDRTRNLESKRRKRFITTVKRSSREEQRRDKSNYETYKLFDEVTDKAKNIVHTYVLCNFTQHSKIILI